MLAQPMTTLQRFLLKWICKNLVIQSQFHKSNITQYYKIMNEAAQDQFNEDNKPTLDGFLTDCHETAKVST